MTRLTDLDVDRFSRKYGPRFRENFRENGVENFRENCSKIAKQFFENERKFSRKSSFAIFVGNPTPHAFTVVEFLIIALDLDISVLCVMYSI